MKLKLIIKEIEKTGKKYRESNSELIKDSYNQYVELMITEVEKSKQYDLCYYWERLKK